MITTVNELQVKRLNEWYENLTFSQKREFLKHWREAFAKAPNGDYSMIIEFMDAYLLEKFVNGELDYIKEIK
jgi:hypothetical protein